ncbi:MAG: acyl-CoA thioesterase [Desulfomonile tiedjei]|uniref:Acyl-CoA thioesterase n=1 Tax=Desulfomonile tiedjei TaxID=2358 RepID=A0A9D6V5F4_9BACT|nr:acyl-CoA thioesterase [Desulfomonile tiedjei]
MKGKTTVKDPCSEVVIRFQDCDPFGHLYNSRYIEYFINAREDHLGKYYGLDIYERQKTCKENWLITKHQIAYLFPVTFREVVSVRTSLLTFTDNSILMEGIMSGTKHEDLKSVIWTWFKYFSFAKSKPAQHPEDIMQLFGVISKSSEIDCSDFDGRVRGLRSQRA